MHAVYAEHHTRAAQLVSQAEIDAAESPSDDWIEIDLTETEAAWYETHRGRFGRRVAETIRAALTR